MSDYVSEDTLLQIFKWLPVKSLLRFRCVCNRFKDIIDSEYFAQYHLAAQTPRLLVAYERPEEFLVLDPRTLPLFDTVRIPSFFEDESETYRLVGTLHGIVCLYDNYNNFYIWNPSIRMYAVVPLPEFIEFGWDDENEIPPYFSFWMDPCTKHFKIIVFKLVFKFTLEPLVNGVLYSSITQEWVLVPLDKLRDYTPHIEGPPVMIGGVAYWRAEHEWMEQGKECRNMVVLSFDFARERFDIMEMPHEIYSGFFVIHCKLQCSLSLVYWYPPQDPYRCAVYLRREGIWVQTFGFNLLPQLSRLYWVWEEMEGRCRALAASDSEALLLYDAKEDCIELRSGLKNYFWGVFVACDYMESLLFPWT